MIEDKQNPNQSDFGFGSIVSDKSRLRLINKDGTFNIYKRGINYLSSFNIFYYLLTISWAKFIFLTSGGYILLNIFFASVFMLVGGNALSGSPGDSFWIEFLRDFFFSVQTSSTIGYGHIAPVGLAANIVVTIESFIGLLGFAMITGLFFARFSRPVAKIKFSDNALIAPYKNGRALMFRLANIRNDQINELEAKVSFSYLRVINSKPKREYTFLNLERNTLPFFPLSWTIVHPIDSESPLYKLTADELVMRDVEVLILVRGIEEAFNQTVITRYSYKANEIVFGARFENIFDRSEPGEPLSVGLHKLGNFELVELPEE